jgi:signal transduction histidine kinase/CheY-like chemotaxis protein
VIVFTNRTASADPVVSAERLARLGNVTLVDRPLRRPTLVSVVRSALRARRRQYTAREVLVRLETAVRQRDDFLALLGHELRNPLSAIQMAADLAAAGSRPERNVQVVRRQARQLARLVDDLLDVSRVTAGKVTLRKAPVDLQRLVERCAELQALSALGEQGVEVRFTSGPPLWTVGDPARLEQVVSNLLSNAVKYTPRGGHVLVSAEAEGPFALIRVRDDGIGIARTDLDRIFEPFVQIDAALDRARGGMGLGLTLVQTLARAHGGEVQVASAGLGRGSEFTVRLPIVPAVQPAPTVEPGTAPARDVLLVEDNDDVRLALSEALTIHGHRVRAARDGPTGLALAQQVRPEVAFVDIGLPQMDGYEVARHLREEHGRAPYLVALTGYGRPEDRELAQAAGFDLHLTKPVDMHRVHEILAGAGRGG